MYIFLFIIFFAGGIQNLKSIINKILEHDRLYPLHLNEWNWWSYYNVVEGYNHVAKTN